MSGTVIKNTFTKINLFQRVRIITLFSLEGVASKKMRGVTLDYNDELNILETTMFFDEKLTEEEEEEMQIANTTVVAALFDVISDFPLELKVIPSNESISHKYGNWGWIYLRHEY